MIDWHFENAQSSARGPHLHLQVPTVGFFFHRQSLECVVPDGAKRTHVGVTNAVEESHDQAGDPAGKNLLEIHAARFAFAARARSDHEIVSPGHNWID